MNTTHIIVKEEPFWLQEYKYQIQYQYLPLEDLWLKKVAGTDCSCWSLQTGQSIPRWTWSRVKRLFERRPRSNGNS